MNAGLRGNLNARSTAGVEKLSVMTKTNIQNSDGPSLNEAEFDLVRVMVKKLTGIVIKPHKRTMLQSRLARRLRATSISSFSSYLDFVNSREGEAEIGELVNAVTTNLTSFFREGHHFEHLRNEILKPMAAAGHQRARIWSSACSSGEEPYCIAMTALAQSAGRISDMRILATDLDTNMLATAKRGVYPEERVEAIPAAERKNFLTRTPDGDFRFRQNLRDLIMFNQLNLLHEWPMRGPFDAIFCRNVLIYFDTEDEHRIIDKMANLLRPHGVLYLGHSESLLGEHPLLSSEGRTIYRRKP